MNAMKYIFKMWALPLLLGFIIAGCDNRDGIIYPPANTAPTIIFTNPLNAATNVALNQIIAATFNETMDAATITSATFTLMQGTTSVPGTVGYSGTVATYIPSSNLLSNTTYTAMITTGAKDLEGAGLVSNYVWSFTTGTTSSTYTVTLSSSPPAGGTTSGSGTFNSGSSVTVTATPNSGYTFTNWTENGIEVSATSSYQFILSGNRTLVANFSSPSLTYTVILSSNPSAGGSTSGGGTFNSGSSVTVIATANFGYTFTNWTENGIEVSKDSSYTFIIVLTSVTEATRLNALPFRVVNVTTPAVEKVTPDIEIIVPSIVPPPAPLIVAALPTCQKIFSDCAPPTRIILRGCPARPTVNVDAIWNTHTAFGSPWASRVKSPEVISNEPAADVYVPGAKTNPPNSPAPGSGPPGRPAR